LFLFFFPLFFFLISGRGFCFFPRRPLRRRNVSFGPFSPPLFFPYPQPGETFNQTRTKPSFFWGHLFPGDEMRGFPRRSGVSSGLPFLSPLPPSKSARSRIIEEVHGARGILAPPPLPPPFWGASGFTPAILKRRDPPHGGPHSLFFPFFFFPRRSAGTRWITDFRIDNLFKQDPGAVCGLSPFFSSFPSPAPFELREAWLTKGGSAERSAKREFVFPCSPFFSLFLYWRSRWRGGRPIDSAARPRSRLPSSLLLFPFPPSSFRCLPFLMAVPGE